MAEEPLKVSFSMSGLFTIRITAKCSDGRIFYQEWSNCKIGLLGDFMIRDSKDEPIIKVVRSGLRRVVYREGEEIGFIRPHLYGRGAMLFSKGKSLKVEEEFSIYYPHFKAEGFYFRKHFRSATAEMSKDFSVMKFAFCFFRLMEDI